MNIIKRFRVIIALVALVAFFGLVNLSASPAAGEMSAGAIERTGAPHQAKKSPLLPIVIGVAVVGVVAAVLILVVFKTKYDPIGSWDFWWKDVPGDEWTIHHLTFSGDRTSGTLFYVEGNVSGTFSLDGKKLHFVVMFTAEDTVIADGEFQDKDTVTGSYTAPLSPSVDGRFELHRQTGTVSMKPKTTGKLAGK